MRIFKKILQLRKVYFHNAHNKSEKQNSEERFYGEQRWFRSDVIK